MTSHLNIDLPEMTVCYYVARLETASMMIMIHVRWLDSRWIASEYDMKESRPLSYAFNQVV